ncbi:MAG: L,D-transpeptidase family protein [Candidatus Omnitrophica bacterium]|nr:L,D-transpeptidase family protein [Candidatus Omnitrophota bacterium]
MITETTAQPSSNEPKGEILLEQANQMLEDRNLSGAKNAYREILSEYNDIENIDTIQDKLEKVNMELIFSNSPSEDAVVHEVVSGDTLGELAKKYGTTIELIKKKNNLKSDVIRIGQKLTIWTGQFNIFVDKSQNILILKDDEEVLKVYNVSTGKNNSTPVGDFKITSKLIDPVWFNKGVIVPPESPANVLGSRWLGFDIPGYGIHGTVEPETIGQQVTAGCVRMRNTEVEELYSIIPTGTMVKIVD